MPQLDLQKLYQKEMNRKEFLAHVGAGFLAVVGISGLIKNLIEYSGTSHSTTVIKHVNHQGYSASTYGGSVRR